MAGAPSDALRCVPLFADLDEAELRQVALLFKKRHFTEASVSVAGNARGSLRAGDHFGEIALIDEGVRSATIVAVTDLDCYGLTYWEFRPLLLANGAIGLKLLQSVAQKLRAAESA